jgi:hypothetical protein
MVVISRSVIGLGEIAAAQARDHVVRRPDCPRCDRVCRAKDYRDPAVATLFGQVTMKLPRFRRPGVVGSRPASAGHHSVDRHPNWTGSGHTFRR